MRTSIVILFLGSWLSACSGGDVDGFVKTIATVLEKIPTDAKIIPGHGPLASKAEILTRPESPATVNFF